MILVLCAMVFFTAVVSASFFHTSPRPFFLIVAPVSVLPGYFIVLKQECRQKPWFENALDERKGMSGDSA